MNLTKGIAFISLAIFISFSFGDGYLFKNTLKSNAKYITEMSMVMNSTNLDSTGKEVDGTGPMAAMNMTMKMRMINTTGTLLENGQLPVLLTYDTMVVRNGIMADGPEERMEDLFSDLILYGHADANARVTIDSIIGIADDNPAFAQLNAQTLQNGMITVEFPDRPLEVGESFSQDMSGSFQAAQIPDATSAMTFTLKKVEDDVAYFDTEMTVNGTMGEMMKLNAIGTGTMTFDIKNKYVSGYENDLVTNMKISVGGQNSNMEMTMNQSISITLQ